MQYVAALVFFTGIILMVVGTIKSRDVERVEAKTDRSKNRYSRVGYGMLALGCAYYIYWFVFR